MLLKGFRFEITYFCKRKKMNAQGLRAVIQQLKRTNIEDNAYLGFFYNDDDYENCYIKANKEGLELFATKLLEASLEMDYRMFSHHNKEVFNLTKKGFAKHSDVQFTFIELLNKTKKEINSTRKKIKKAWIEKIIGCVITGCFIFTIILIWHFFSHS